MSKRRVVITGLGVISPVGNSVEDAWASILAGKSGIGPITHFDVSGFPVRFGGEVRDFDITDYISAKEARKMAQFIHYGVAAASQAFADSGVEITEANSARAGLAIGSGIGGLPGIEQAYQAYLDGGPRKISPFFVPANIINMVAGNLSIKYGFKGPNHAVVTACSTGAHAIGDAARLIQWGDADVMVAGGAEAAICEIGIAGFNACKALSTKRGDDPKKASRPYDADRDGFVMGEGAGIVVLEEKRHAQSRRAAVLGELLGYGDSADAFHITDARPDGECGRQVRRDYGDRHAGQVVNQLFSAWRYPRHAFTGSGARGRPRLQ